MGSIVLYIIEWAFALLVLLAIYKAVFSGTTLYRFNRFYLLGATLLSALLPLVHVTIPDSTPLVSEMSIQETEFAQELSGTFMFASEPETTIAEPFIEQPASNSHLWPIMLVCAYSVYVLTLIIGWSRGILRARRFLKGKQRRRISRTVWLVTHDEAYGPFSWMNYIVISNTESGFARRASLRHEFSHVRLMHSIDLIILLACTIVNPVCWLVLQEIKIVHEFEADDEVINRYGIQEQDYQRLLLIRTVGAEAYALASSFNLNIKKRIIMMNKNKTRKSRLIWLLLLIPMLGMTSVLFARTGKAVNLDDKLRFTSGNAEMSYRLPQPMEPYNYSGPSAAVTPGPPPPPAAVTRAEYIRVIGDDEVISDELRNDAQRKNEMLIRQRNVMTIQINKLNDIYVRNGLVNRVIKIDELKDLAKQFIKNPDNDSRLPIIEDYNIDGYGTVKTTVRHVFSLQYDRSSSAGVWSDVRYELQKAYNELRDELCMSKFGKAYDQCSDSQQKFARAMYANKISEAQPKSYDGEGNTIKKEVRSAAGNYVVKDEKVNKDLRIRVINNPPVRLYVSTVIFDNENGQDQFKSETDPIQISLENLDDYIDQAISDGMKIRKVRLAIRPDVPMGPISDLKETFRNRMLLNIVQESYNKPDEVAQNNQSFVPDDDDEVKINLDKNFVEHKEGDVFKELLMVVSYDPMRTLSSIRTFQYKNGEDILLSETTPKESKDMDELDKFAQSNDLNEVTRVRIAFSPDVPTGLAQLIKNMFRSKKVLNMIYESYDEQKAEEEIFNGKLPETVQYIRDNINYPDEAKQDPNGTVLASFTIGKDGNVMNPEITGSADHTLDAQALQVLSQMPAWVPARNENGEAIEVKYTIPVSTPLPHDLE